MSSEQDPDINDFMEKTFAVVRKGITKEEMLDMYEGWASTYDKTIRKAEMKYTWPLLIAVETEKRYGDRKDVRLLDVGAGTGYVGWQLHQNGFHNIDGLDASAPMLEEAKKQNIYKNTIVTFLSAEKLDVADNAYDGIVSAGCWFNGHIKADCFEELIRLVKPGGWIITIMMQHEHEENYRQKMEELQTEGRWECVQITEIDERETFKAEQYGLNPSAEERLLSESLTLLITLRVC